MRLGAGEAGANKLAAYYEKQASTHAKMAKRFFVGLLLSLVATAALILIAFVAFPVPIASSPGADVRWEEFLRGLVVRLVLLGLTSYVVALMSRNYRVNKHLQVLNETKRNALNTYVLFAESVPTEETRALITSELVRAVFGPGDSGYLGESAEKTIIESPPSLSSILAMRPPT